MNGGARRGDTLAGVLLIGAVGWIAAEVVAFVVIGDHLGFGWALLLLLVVSALGPFIVRRVGLGVIARTQQRLATGALPTRELLDGVVVLLAGALICLPGFVTDAIGLLLLVGPIRHLLIRAAGKRLAHRVQSIRPRQQVIDVAVHRAPNEPIAAQQLESGEGRRR